MSGKLALDPATVHQARALAARVGEPIVRMATEHTTVSVERATLRLAGLGGADADGTPWANRLADCVRADLGLEHGLALPVWDALLRGEADDLPALAQKASAGSVRFRLPDGAGADEVREAARAAVGAGVRRIDARRREREQLIADVGDAPAKPWIYLIVATGDIHEDIPQAQAAARAWICRLKRWSTNVRTGLMSRKRMPYIESLSIMSSRSSPARTAISGMHSPEA